MSQATPLLNVFVMWHEKADVKCRPVAEALFRLLSWNHERPFAREIGIPTYFRCQLCIGPSGGHADINLDGAEQTIVFALIESHAVIDDPWKQSLVALQRLIDGSGGRHRLILVGVDENGSKLPPPLTDRLIIRLESKPESERTRHLCLHAAAQIGRFLGRHGVDGKSAVNLFISHTKRDERSLALARQVRDLLQQEGPYAKYFFDAMEIQPAEDIAATVDESIAGSTLLVVRTDGYAASPWCQLEVLAAKRHRRPIVVLDSLQSREDRAFPAAANVPFIRVDEGLSAGDLSARLIDVIEAAIVETMRFLYVDRKIRHLSATGRLPADVIHSARPPEDRDLRCLAPGQPHVIVYPDPPLALCELEGLAHGDTVLTTPLTHGGPDLTGRVIGISISTPQEGLRELGLSESHIDAAMDLIARGLLSRGASLAYGGDLRSGGFTDFLGGIVAANNSARRDPYERIQNILPWPKSADLDVKEIAQRADKIRVERMEVPEDVLRLGLDGAGLPDATTARGRYARARGMLEMRERMTARINARIALGGKRHGFSGRYPGILDEVLLGLRARKPIFVLGGFGGAAQDMADVLRGGVPQTLNVNAINALSPGYAEMISFYNHQIHTQRLPIEPIDLPAALAEIQKAGVAGLNNGLTEAENCVLLATRDVEEAMWLILKGLDICLRKTVD